MRADGARSRAVRRQSDFGLDCGVGEPSGSIHVHHNRIEIVLLLHHVDAEAGMGSAAARLSDFLRQYVPPGTKPARTEGALGRVGTLK